MTAQYRPMKETDIASGPHFSPSLSQMIIAPIPEYGMQMGTRCHWLPSTMWHIGGPIIDRERFHSLAKCDPGQPEARKAA